MKVLDPGHKYELAVLDGDLPVILTYTKRIGDKYPGNEPPAYSGTTLQEEWRAQIDRLRYLNNQESHWVNTECANTSWTAWFCWNQEPRASRKSISFY